MILGKDFYYAIRLLEYFSAHAKRSPVALRLPIGWVLSGPLTSSSCLTSTCFKVNIDHDMTLTRLRTGPIKSGIYPTIFFNPNKPGKVRRVINGAAKFHGASLNKSLLTGPDLLQNPIYVLLRFRNHPYAVSADIEGMFLQVGELPSDQQSLRFLWLEDPTTNVVVYQFTRHIFGAKDSPTCANYALQRTARDNTNFCTKAAKAVLENFYMDDYLDSVESPEKASNRP